MEYLYLIRKREFYNLSAGVFKIGKTRQSIEKRMGGYPKGSQILAIVPVQNCDESEKRVLKIFCEKFKQRRDDGSESFEHNDPRDMIEIMMKEFYCNNLGDQSIISVPKIAIKKSDISTTLFEEIKKSIWRTQKQSDSFRNSFGVTSIRDLCNENTFINFIKELEKPYNISGYCMKIISDNIKNVSVIDEYKQLSYSGDINTFIRFLIYAKMSSIFLFGNLIILNTELKNELLDISTPFSDCYKGITLSKTDEKISSIQNFIINGTNRLDTFYDIINKNHDLFVSHLGLEDAINVKYGVIVTEDCIVYSDSPMHSRGLDKLVGKINEYYDVMVEREYGYYLFKIKDVKTQLCENLEENIKRIETILKSYTHRKITNDLIDISNIYKTMNELFETCNVIYSSSKNKLESLIKNKSGKSIENWFNGCPGKYVSGIKKIDDISNYLMEICREDFINIYKEICDITKQEQKKYPKYWTNSILHNYEFKYYIKAFYDDVFHDKIILDNSCRIAAEDRDDDYYWEEFFDVYFRDTSPELESHCCDNKTYYAPCKIHSYCESTCESLEDENICNMCETAKNCDKCEKCKICDICEKNEESERLANDGKFLREYVKSYKLIEKSRYSYAGIELAMFVNFEKCCKKEDMKNKKIIHISDYASGV